MSEWIAAYDELPPSGAVVELRHTPDSTDPGESPDLGVWRVTSAYDGYWGRGFFADPVHPGEGEYTSHGNAWWDDVSVEWRAATIAAS